MTLKCLVKTQLPPTLSSPRRRSPLVMVWVLVQPSIPWLLLKHQGYSSGWPGLVPSHYNSQRPHMSLQARCRPDVIIVCVFVCVCASPSLYCTAARLKLSDLCGVLCVYDRYFLHWLKAGSGIPPKLLDSREPTQPRCSRSQLPLCPLILAWYQCSPPVNVCPVIE